MSVLTKYQVSFSKTIEQASLKYQKLKMSENHVKEKIRNRKKLEWKIKKKF